MFISLLRFYGLTTQPIVIELCIPILRGMNIDIVKRHVAQSAGET